MRRRFVLGWIVALACAGACREPEPIAQTIVWLDAEPAARASLTRIKVQAIGPASNREPSVETVKPTWPIKLVFAPKNSDASRRFALTIDARDASGTRLATLRLRTGFVRNETRYAILRIQERCTMQASERCGEDDPCNAWSAELAANELSAAADKPRAVDVDCAPFVEGETPLEPEPTEMAGSGAMPEAGSSVATAGSGARPGTGGAAGAPATRPVEGPTGTCQEGWNRVGDACVDVDECANATPCGEHGQCQNAPGSYTCTCSQGYVDASGQCQDLDECQTDNGGCEGHCENSPGGFSCSCDAANEGWLRADRQTCGSFGEAGRVGLTTSLQPMQPRFAFDASGNGVAVWTQSDGTRATLRTRRYVAGQGWTGFASRIPTGDTGSVSSPRIALDAEGRGVLVWLQTADSRADVWAARYRDQRFDAGALIETDDAGSAFDPSVALDATGNGFAVWTQSNGTQATIRANRFDAETGWSEARPIQSSTTDDALTPRLAIDAHGNATVGWTQTFLAEMETPRLSAWTTRFDGTLGRWRLPDMLDDSGYSGVPDSQLFEPAGHGLTVWTRASSTQVSVWARSQSSESSRNDPVQIAPDSSLVAIIPRVALSPQGSGAAIWAQGQSAAYEVWANRYDGANDRWAEAEKLSQSSSTSMISPQIAVDASGDGFGVWAELDGTSRVIRAARLEAGSGFVGQIALAMDRTSDPPSISPPFVAASANGSALAIWDVWNGEQYEVWARAFE